MVLNYPGGLFLPPRADERTLLTIVSDPLVVTPGKLDEVYLALEGRSDTLLCREGGTVRAGEAVARLADGTPIYASVPGRFDGIFENRGKPYARVAVDANADELPVQVREPEKKRLSDLSREELLDAVRTLGIFDVWSGDWLWRRAQNAWKSEVYRVVIDLTDANGWSLTGCRAALRAAGDVLNGAKVLLQLLGATKVLLIVDRTQRRQAKVFRALINDPSLVVLGEVEPKYPLREETLYEAIYARRLPRGRSAQDEGVFFVRAQTAEALYRAMLSGRPQTTRWLTAAGDGFKADVVVQTPLGTPWKRLLELCRFKGGEYVTKLDSPLYGAPAEGVLGGRTESVLSSLPETRTAGHCIACGRCADVCPMRLQPYRILRTRSYRAVRTLAAACIECGCCSYICPAALPLRESIAKHRDPSENP